MSKKILKDLKNKKNIVVLSSLSLLGVAVLSTAIAVPISLEQNKKQEIINNFSNTYEGNKNRIIEFLNNSTKINQSILNGTVSIKKEFSYIDRSFITIDEAKKNNWFDFQLHSVFENILYENDLNASFEYIKPNSTNSTYPVVGIKIFRGEGENYYESIYQYAENGLNGFKQTKEEATIEKIISDIKKDNLKYFQLNQEIGKVGDLGLYAKNIKSNSFDKKIDILSNLRKNNYEINITNVEVDKFFPTNLILTYDVIYEDGDVSFKKTYLKTTITGFDIEYGVDDPKSKVQKFIKDNKESYISNLYQYFKYEKEEGDTKISAREAYEKNKIKFIPTDSALSTSNSAGIVIEFRSFGNEEPNKLNIFPNIEKSNTPMYRLYISSYKDTPLEYSEDVVIEGVGQSDDFKTSQNEIDMNKLIDFFDNSTDKYIDDYFLIDQIDLQNGPFNGKQIADIPFSIFKTAYDKFKENSIKYKAPFNFTIKLNDQKVNEIQDQEIKTLLEKVKTSVNKLDLETKFIKFENDRNIFSINIGLGEKENDLFIGLNSISLNVEGFKEENEYYTNQVDTVLNFIQTGTNSKKLWIKYKSDEGKIFENQAIEYIKHAQWDKIFDSISLLEIPAIEFPDYDEQVKIHISFNELKKYDSSEINKIINDRKLKLPISIQKKGIEKIYLLEKSFDDLFRK